MAHENISRWKASVWETVLYFGFAVFKNISCATAVEYIKDITHEYSSEIRFNARSPTNGVKQVSKNFNPYNHKFKFMEVKHMNLTEVKIRKIFTEGNLKAVVSIVLDYCIAVHDIKVVQGNSRLFVAMPSRRELDGTYRDIIHPMYNDTRDEFEKIILEAYEKYIALDSSAENDNYSA